MVFSRLRSRRGVVAALVAGAFARALPGPVRAQWTNGCEYGMTNGLVTIGGADCGVAVPGHMVDGTGSSLDDASTGSVGTFTDTRKEDRQDRLIDRRDKRRRQRGRRTDRNQDQQDRQQERKILCEDFSTQLQAVEAMSHSPQEAWRLDPDGDGIPCEELTPLTCKALGTEAEATSWFKKMGYTPAYDPFKLYDAETGGVCTKRATCDDFRNQKEAVEWMTDHPKDTARLDPDGDGAPCAKLATVTCKAFSTQDEAKQWFTRNGFSAAKDPYKLIDPDYTEVCPKRATCDDFKTQKAAIEWMKDHPKDKDRLDPNGDGIACPQLTKLTCSQFSSSKEAWEWHDHYKPTNSFWDPYGLFDVNANPQRYCSSLPPTTNG